MLLDIVDLFIHPDAYVCLWRDGELHILHVADLSTPTAAPKQALAL
jgi:hypothetical protein